jgi:hypothetical protein
MSRADDILFYTGISILFLCIILTLFLFSPKNINDNESLIIVPNLTYGEMMDISLGLIEEGDIILMKPKSIPDSYFYEIEREGKSSRVKNFIFYIFFDKILISSTGNRFWHTGVYIGNGTINSLYFTGIKKTKIDEKLFEYEYLKILSVKTSDDIKKSAIKKSEEHFKNQDIYYSLKNGLLIIFLESTASKKQININENELVCSSYVAYLYNEIKFNDKPFTHVTPIVLEISDMTETKLLFNETGFYKK